MSIQIIELKERSQFAAIYPLIRQLNPELTREQFDVRLQEMLTQGYRCIAAMEGDKVMGACGFWYGTRFWCGRFIDLDNVVVDEAARSGGIGEEMVKWVEAEAKRLGCDQLGLDAYVTSTGAHRFYFRHGFIIKGYHFVKNLLQSRI